MVNRLGLTLTLLLVSATSSDAQFCFRGRPTPDCSAYTLTEFAIVIHREFFYTVAENPFYISWELGVMANASSRSSVGGTLLAGHDGGGDRLGVKARYRHWIGPTIGLDIAPGILIAGSTSSGAEFVSPGFTGHIGLTWKDLFAATVQFEVVRFSGPLPPGETPGSEAIVSVGVRLGSYVGTVSGLAVLAGYLIFAASYSGT